MNSTGTKTNEVQGSSATRPTEEKPLPSASPTIPNQPGVEFHKNFGEATKYTVFVIFVLYSVGFIIWHAYLGRFGVTAIAFLQAEYLAAAFCYLFVLATLSIPPILLLRGIKRNISSKGLLGISNWDDDNWIFIGTVWYFLILRVVGVFLPGSLVLTPRGQHATDVIGCFLILHIILIIFYVTKAGYLRVLWDGKDVVNEKKLAWRNSKKFKFFANQHVFAIYTLCMGLAFLVFNPKINSWFLFSTMFLYVTATFGISSNFKETWKKASLMTRALVVILICLILISNIQSFAASQFGEIPKSAGGGKPELAYLKFAKENSDVPISMELLQSTNLSSTTNFSIFGPVGILFRSDRQIILINNVATNFLSSTNLTAREVRADLVEGIIYCK
jgi:hypothetical protein